MNNLLHLPKEINHKKLFFWGFVFYLIIPLIILQTDLLDGLPGIDPWKKNNFLKPDLFSTYLLLITLFFIVFYAGSFIGTRYIKLSYPKTKILGPTSAKITLLLCTAFTIIFFFKARGAAFQGYTTDNFDDGIVGIISTTNLLLFFIHFVIIQPKKTKTGFLILLIFNSIFLLGLGGRMYVVIPLVAYFVRAYNQRATSGKSLLPYVFLVIGIALIAAILGAIRIGSDFSLLTYFIFAEPIFTSYSSFSFLNQNALSLIKIPYNFIFSFLNIIPSLFWPGKAEMMATLATGWAKFDNPLGALSIFATIFGDFGIIGGGIFVFLFGVFFGHLYKSYKSGAINKNVYYCFCSILPFSFFRDPIAIPIKIFIFSFVILPFILKILRLSLKK